MFIILLRNTLKKYILQYNIHFLFLCEVSRIIGIGDRINTMYLIYIEMLFCVISEYMYLSSCLQYLLRKCFPVCIQAIYSFLRCNLWTVCFILLILAVNSAKLQLIESKTVSQQDSLTHWHNFVALWEKLWEWEC